jgi:arabinofuranan 3-O-arabinosyltransferase
MIDSSRRDALDSAVGEIPPVAVGDAGSAIDERARGRLWVLACCLALAVLTFVDRPGKIIADTKLDIAISPIAFLERAAHLWDPAQFGQLQDQASGYFFPMGPFFVLGKLAALEPWVVQRLWLTAVLLAAFIGVTKLTARLGIGSQRTQIVAGLAYALAPAVVGEVGAISIEVLPAAMAPWIMLPLVTAVQGSRSRSGLIRAAARSAVAVALCSGVNATSVVAALAPAFIYLCTVPRPAPRWRLMACWTPMVIMATWIWLVPLALLNSYGVSLLPYTESASVTTSVTSLSNVLRGTEDWVGYLVINGHSWWPVEFWLSNAALATVATALIAGLGLAGLLGMAAAVRRPLLCILLAGVIVILIGYRSGLGSPLTATLDHLVNGPLAPFRNVRKFDPLIRLPVCMGIAQLLAGPRPALSRITRSAITQRATWAAAVVAIAIPVIPAFVGGLSPRGDFVGVPQYWRQAARWLNKHAGNSAVLEEPGSQFGEYIWGRPMDDVLQPLFDGDWASRQLSAVGSVGSTRLLNAIDQRMAAGDGSAGLTQVLERMGVRYIVVRNDVLRADLQGAWPARIHQAISESPGIVRVAQFGTLPIGNFGPDDAVSNFDSPYPPVEIYQVRGAQAPAVVTPASSAMRVYGGPEALLTLADQGLLRGRPVLINSDSPGVTARWNVITDSLRRRVVNFGELRSDYSPTLAAGAQLRTFEVVPDYMEPAWQRFESVARYYGILNVTASSSDADITANPAQSGTGLLPYSALDGDLRTMWESGGLRGPVGQWIRVDFLQPVSTRTIRVAFVDNPDIGPPVTAVTITTAAGKLTDRVRATGAYQTLAVPSGPSSWLRVTVARTERMNRPAIGRQVGIVEIAIPGVSASRTIVAPTVALPGGAGPASVVLAKAEPQPSGCMLTSIRWVCSPKLVKPTEEQYGFDESFSASRSGSDSLRGRAVLTQDSLIARYAWGDRGQPVVTGAPGYTPDPEDQPQSAFDGNSQTTWVAGALNRAPRLRISWTKVKTISGITITRPPAADAPMPVLIIGSNGQVRGGVAVGPKAVLKFAPMRTSSLGLRFTPPALPLQVTDVRIPGVRPLVSGGSATFELPCGFGPRVQVNGTVLATRATGTYTGMLTGQPLRFSACGPVAESAGMNRVVEPPWDGFDVQSVTLSQFGDPALAAGSVVRSRPARVISWTSSRRVLRVSASQPSFLVVNENYSKGWTASLAHRVLRPVRLDGWKQAWYLPAGTVGTVTLSYPPDAKYRENVLVGLVAIVLLIGLALMPGRRGSRPGLSPGAARGAASGRSLRLAARSSVPLLLAGAAATAAAGLWLAGYPGAVILPLATAGFAIASALAERNPLCRIVASPWLVAGLLLTAGLAGAVGIHLRDDGSAGPIAVLLWNTGPQLLCLIAIARIAAALAPTGARSSAAALGPADS